MKHQHTVKSEKSAKPLHPIIQEGSVTISVKFLFAKILKKKKYCWGYIKKEF